MKLILLALVIFIAWVELSLDGDHVVDETRVLSLLKELVSTNSENPPGYEKEVADVLIDHMTAHGFSFEMVGPEERPNVVFYTHPGKTGKLVLHGHMDTVPTGPLDSWSYAPFGAEVVSGRLYGRGSCDMKGPVAAMAEAMILYKEAGHQEPLVMLTTSDEESGCSGAERVVESGLLQGVPFGICGEPTSLNVLVGEKGMFWSKLIAEGKSAHGSRPEEGINAINLCLEALRVLITEPYSFEPNELLGKPTLNLGMINGGIKINVVPAYCEALLDMRIVKGQSPEKLLITMNERLSSAGLGETTRVDYVHGKPAVVTPRDSEIVNISLDVVESVTGHRCIPTAATYGTDCSVLQPKGGIINVICGPGSIEQAHQPDEFISLEELYKSVDVYMGIARHFADST